MMWLWKVRWWLEDRAHDAAVAILQVFNFAQGGEFHYDSDGMPFAFPNRRVEDTKPRLFYQDGEAEQIAQAPYPHCDSFVLHAPGKCEVCDLYPTYQAARIAAGINFTGEHRLDRRKCPSEERRPLETIERWPGNRPWES